MQILLHDPDFIAVHKPAGLLAHPSPIDRHEKRHALGMARQLAGCHVYPAHRLDKPTSGVLLFALNPWAARELAGQFAGRQVEKTYLAVVRGIAPESVVIDHPLADEPDRLAGQESPVSSPPRESITCCRRLAIIELPFAVGRYSSSRYSIVEARPITGRRRQIRRHLKHLLHPIIGDTTYGEGRHNRLFRDQFGVNRLLLAAMELSFAHPRSGEPITVTAPLDGEFASIIRRFGWEAALPSRWLAPA